MDNVVLIDDFDSLSSPLDREMEGDRTVARELFTRLRMVSPHSVKSLPHDGRLSLQAHGLSIEMVCAESAWFSVKGSTEFCLQTTDEDWVMASEGAIAWSELKKAQDFCESMMGLWEQVMMSLEFADRIE